MMGKDVCVHCGCVLEPGESYFFQEACFCESCYHELTVTCDHCGKRIFRDNDEGDSRITLCSRCAENFYVACDRCGCLIHNENAYYQVDDEDTPFCYECYEKTCYIHHYHYKPDPVFYGDSERWFGIELEVDEGGELQGNAKKVLNVANASAWNLYIKRDGSLNDGFELVTHPMSIDYHLNTMPWQSVLSKLRELGYRSHQTSTAGLHIHVNRDSLGDSLEEQEDTIARILFFVEKHWDELVRFSRRTQRQLERWAGRYGLKGTPKEILDTAKGGFGRYTCVNLCNDQTVEFRFFRGTLKYNTLMASIFIVDLICTLSRTMSDQEIKELSWTDFIDFCTQPELILYLKERQLYGNNSGERVGET